MRTHVLSLIEREAAHARAGRPARLIAKLNALVDSETIHALYAASQAGVEIDLIVRGICCLKPQVPGQSDRIRVISILGRFLEHSRVWYVANDGDPEYYIGSADWMPRNFDTRVECVVTVEDPSLHGCLASLLETCLADNRQAWDLAPDGTYAQRKPQPGDDVIATQAILQKNSWGGTGRAEITASGPTLVP
jgi:polyphosphate kinase